MGGGVGVGLQEHGTPPHELIIHCGGNSISLVSLKELAAIIKPSPVFFWEGGGATTP